MMYSYNPVKNVQVIGKSRKIYHGSHEKLESKLRAGG